MYRSLISKVYQLRTSLVAQQVRYASTANITGPSHTAVPPYIKSQYNPISRTDVTAILLQAKQQCGKSFADLGYIIGRNEVYTTSAIYGQHTLSRTEAELLFNGLNVDPQYKSDVVAQLQTVPYRGCDYDAVANDPVIYRFNEIVKVYGTTLKALIHEHYGDGIMSAIDFSCEFEKTVGKQGEGRIQVTLNGKFLPYTKF